MLESIPRIMMIIKNDGGIVIAHLRSFKVVHNFYFTGIGGFNGVFSCVFLFAAISIYLRTLRWSSLLNELLGLLKYAFPYNKHD
jgi:hypothetical protein